MDPLSVTSSIAGILAAAGKVVEILEPVVSATLNVNLATAKAVCSETNNSIIILSAAQTLFNDPDLIPRKRKGLIQVNQLVAALTDGVLIFSELEALVLQLGTSMEKVKTRILWARKEKTFLSIRSRMQSFKLSISVMLNIIQW
jgi:hypothetical protein